MPVPFDRPRRLLAVGAAAHEHCVAGRDRLLRALDRREGLLQRAGIGVADRGLQQVDERIVRDLFEPLAALLAAGEMLFDVERFGVRRSAQTE